MDNKVLVETSARHVHLTKEHFEILFGAGATLTKKKDLSQPGQFACAEKVSVVGPKKEQPGVSILGPFRKETQIELSATDARSLGIAAPVRQSGELAGSGACKLVGPCGEIQLDHGVIVAKRHIHMTTKEAAELGIVDNQIVEVKMDCEGRKLTFGDVVVRVSDSYALAMHIDTDESNAAGCAGTVYGEIIK